MTMRTTFLRSLYIALALWVAAAQAGQDVEPDKLNICIDYHCEKNKNITLSNTEWQQLFQPFARQASNAQQERKQISESIALFEEIVGRYAGTDKDRAKNDGEDEIGQLDCISESTNTALYLRTLDNKGKLRWHSVDERKRRSTFLFDVHWSAVIKDKASGNRYVVDSWFYKNGAAPVIQPLGQWLDKKPASNQLVP